MSGTQTAGDLIDAIENLADGEDTVSVRDVVETLGRRGFGALLFVPAMVVCTPLGGIPGVPTIMAILILLIAGQIVIGRSHFWVPDILGARAVKDDRLAKAAEKARPAADRLDHWIGARWQALLRGPAPRIAALAAMALCVTVPPLEVVPFAALVPMLAIVLIGLALSVHDGLLMLVALIAACAALWSVAWLLI